MTNELRQTSWRWLHRAWGVREAMRHAKHKLSLDQCIPQHDHTNPHRTHTHQRVKIFFLLDKFLDVTWDQNLRACC